VFDNKAIQAVLLVMTVMLMAGCAVKPNRFEPEQILQTVLEDRNLVKQQQVHLEGPLSLYESMARAVSYNLDHRIRMMEEAMAMGQLDLARYDLLPLMVAKAGYNWRTEEDASYSRGYVDRILSDRASFSDNPSRFTADLRFSWSILDFGVSYYQAKQEADRYLVARNNRLKLVQRLMHQTRVAYTRAQAAMELRPQIRTVLSDAHDALGQLDKLSEQRLQHPLTTLQSKRALLELIGQLESLEQSFLRSEIELKALINVPPGQTLELERSKVIDNLPSFNVPLADLELMALQNSLDISEQMYATRIEQLETRKSLLRLFPDLSFGIGANYDNNSYLVHSNWYDLGADLSWNLMRLATIGSMRKAGEIREGLADTRRMALNMAVVTRLHTSWQQYNDTLSQVKRARQLDQLELEIARHSRADEAADSGSRIERIRSEASALRARMRRHETEAAAQDALGIFVMSLGIDVSAQAQGQRAPTLEELTQQISEQMGLIERGVLPEIKRSSDGPLIDPVSAVLPTGAGAEADTDTDIDRKEPSLRLTIGPFADTQEQEKALAYLRQQGLEVKQTDGEGAMQMHRVLTGVYPKEEAQVHFRELQKISPSAFLLTNDGQRYLFAGSFQSRDRAEAFMEKLRAKGLPVTLQIAMINTKGNMLVSEWFNVQRSDDIMRHFEDSGITVRAEEYL
jgi:outer membrane protein TolC